MATTQLSHAVLMDLEKKEIDLTFSLKPKKIEKPEELKQLNQDFSNAKFEKVEKDLALSKYRRELRRNIDPNEKSSLEKEYDIHVQTLDKNFNELSDKVLKEIRDFSDRLREENLKNLAS